MSYPYNYPAPTTSTTAVPIQAPPFQVQPVQQPTQLQTAPVQIQAPLKAEPFQFPSPIEGCDCLICTRAGVDRTVWREATPVFEPYHVEVITGPTTSIQCTADDMNEFQQKFAKQINFTNEITTFPWHQFCLATVRKISRHVAAKPFKAPVDWVKLNIPDYPKIVKHPIDLGTIEARLVANPCVYSNPDDVISDVRMVFRNTYLFNPGNHPIVMTARTLSTLFEEELLTHMLQ